jgi:hypothetical protein
VLKNRALTRREPSEPGREASSSGVNSARPSSRRSGCARRRSEAAGWGPAALYAMTNLLARMQDEGDQRCCSNDRSCGSRASWSCDTCAGRPRGNPDLSVRDRRAALTDGFRLARAMTFKAAAADLPVGGGRSSSWNRARSSAKKLSKPWDAPSRSLAGASSRDRRRGSLRTAPGSGRNEFHGG